MIGKVNLALNFLVLILAVVSGTYGWLLFQRRAELRERGEKLANVVSDIVKELDAESGTEYAKSVHRDQISGKDGAPLAGGTLGWAYFHDIRDPATKSYQEYDNVLEKVRKQISDYRVQRNFLAKGIADVASLFEQAGNDPILYQDMNTYEDAFKEVNERLEMIHRRDVTIIDKIDETANKIGIKINREDLKNIDKFEEPLKELGNQVSKIKERAINFSDTVEQIVSRVDAHAFKLNSEMLKDETAYVGELTSILNDFTDINEKLKDYEKYKVEFLENKNTLERTRNALESANENLTALEGKLANVEAEYASIQKKYNRLVGETTTTGAAQLKKIEGRVIDVNYDWNYVIIDLGKKDSLPDNLEMIIAREKEYICKVLVTKVYDDYSVADILTKMKIGNVIEGDRVIF